jgi:iron complex outermembrane receptor protein
VLWNGFNLQDLLNGGVDCSLLPINFVDDIKVQYGGCSALFGSGAIGGVIHLNNTLNFEKGLSSSISTGYGSYDNIFGGLNLGYSNASYSGFIRSFYNNAQNNFKFKNTIESNSPTQILKNAEREQYGILAGNAIKLGIKSKLESFVWFQDNDKNIPPTMATFSNPTNDNERDRFYRATASWKTWGNNSDFSLRSGFSNYFMTYDTSNFQSIQSSTNAEYNLKINANHLLNIGLDYTYEKGIAESLISNAQRNRIALFTSYRFTDNESKWKIALNFRDEAINQNFTPLTFSLGFERTITNSLLLKGIVSKNYRVPTFNDLYWEGLGNPNLKCESGLNEDLGFIFSPKIDRIGIRYEASGFNNMVTNWILWYPHVNQADKGKWKPENMSEVWARGIENDLSVVFPIDKLLVKTSISYSFTKSTKSKADFAGDPALNKQLIYVPLHKGLFSFTLKYKGFDLYYGQSYAGRRYSEMDNSRFVSPYSIGNISISKNLTFWNQALTISLQANNLWNSDYQVMEYYPMPPRNYQINIHLNFK